MTRRLGIALIVAAVAIVLIVWLGLNPGTLNAPEVLIGLGVILLLYLWVRVRNLQRISERIARRQRQGSEPTPRTDFWDPP